MGNIQSTQSGKMSPALSAQTKDLTSDQSLNQSARLKTQRYQFLDLRSGKKQDLSWKIVTPSPGERWMLNIGAFPREDRESTLSHILQGEVQEKYFLSQKACQGILTRAARRNKKLPEVLEKALMAQAGLL